MKCSSVKQIMQKTFKNVQNGKLQRDSYSNVSKGEVEQK